jgi:hypothetical protein
MSKVRDLHNKAMELAQLALVARHSNEPERANVLARQAYELESQAAELVPYGESSEPTRSILYRSAASLAYQCKELADAQRLIAKGLSGYPPSDVENELKNLLMQVNFEKNLQSQDLALSQSDVQLSMRGNAVGLGVIPYKEFTRRVDNFFSLTTKTIQRRLGREFQSSGQAAKMYRPFVPTLGAPTSGSFIITLKLVHPEETQQLSFLIDIEQLIDEVITGIDLVNKSDDRALRGLIKDETYYYHFVSLTREMAPDGDRVSSVGFTTKSRAINLTRYHNDIPLIAQPQVQLDKEKLEVTTVIGKLDYAVAREKGVIGLTTEENRHFTISVHEGLEDLVRSYFGQWVEVVGPHKGTSIYLRDIHPVDLDE